MPRYPNGKQPPAVLLWGIYARVSSAEQDGPDTSSIEDQLSYGGQIVEREGGVLVDRYVDRKPYRDSQGRKVEPSGERADRPEWLRLQADLKSGRINAIAAFHEWRLYRDFRPFTDFIEIARVTKPVVRLWHGQWTEQFAVFGAWMGRADNDHRVAQANKGKRGKAERGFPLTRAPCFYRVLRNEKGDRTGYELRPEAQPFLDRLAQLFIARLSYADMSIQLGRNPITGGALTPDKLRDILRNPFFRGQTAPEWRTGRPWFTVESVAPPAWDADTCAAVVAELERRASLGRSITHKGGFLLSGLVRCGICGRLMSGKLNKRALTPWYSCALGDRYHKPQPGDLRQHAYNGISQHRLLSQLREACQNTPDDGAAQFSFPARAHIGPTAAEAQAKLDELQATQDEYNATPESSVRARQFLAGEVSRLSKELAALEATYDRAAHAANAPAAERPSLAEFYAGKPFDLPPDELRAALLAQFDVLWVKDKHLCGPPEEMWIRV